MKPIAEWTLGQKLKVLQYLTNIDYVEIVLEMGSYKEDDKTVFEIPIVVRKFMEKEMPEVWDEYLLKTLDEYEFDSAILNDVLSLDNLLTYLMEHTDRWGWKECPYCFDGQIDNIDNFEPCSYCNGTGKVKTDALVYMESLKEERCEKR